MEVSGLKPENIPQIITQIQNVADEKRIECCRKLDDIFEKGEKEECAIDLILTTFSTTNNNKIIYHIFPIRISRTSMIDIEKNELGYLQEIGRFRQSISQSGPIFRKFVEYMGDRINYVSGDGSYEAGYRFEKYPVMIRVDPIVISPSSLSSDVDEGKYLEAFGIHLSSMNNLDSLIEYLKKRQRKVLEADTINYIENSIWETKVRLRKKRTNIFYGILFMVGILNVFILMDLIPDWIVKMFFWLMICAVGLLLYSFRNHYKQITNPITSEEDLFLPENKRYLDLHKSLLIEGEDAEFSRRIDQEFIQLENKKNEISSWSKKKNNSNYISPNELENIEERGESEDIEEIWDNEDNEEDEIQRGSGKDPPKESEKPKTMKKKNEKKQKNTADSKSPFDYEKIRKENGEEILNSLRAFMEKE